ncbi:MAG: hypothetical protein LAT83_05455 [Kiritimatiellae bacterium]|nr:hypothetical protein [Kiritimatiellia bacterium]
MKCLFVFLLISGCVSMRMAGKVNPGKIQEAFLLYGHKNHMDFGYIFEIVPGYNDFRNTLNYGDYLSVEQNSLTFSLTYLDEENQSAMIYFGELFKRGTAYRVKTMRLAYKFEL